MQSPPAQKSAYHSSFKCATSINSSHYQYQKHPCLYVLATATKVVLHSVLTTTATTVAVLTTTVAVLTTTATTITAITVA